MRAVDLLKNKFGVSQLYKYDLIEDEQVVLTIFWHPLTIAERNRSKQSQRLMMLEILL